MPNASTIPLILLMVFLWVKTKGKILPAVLFTSVFAAASAIDLGSLGISCWLFTLTSFLVVKLLIGHHPVRFTAGLNKTALYAAILFVSYAAWTGMVYPILFRGVPVVRLVATESLSWGLSNFAQLCYLMAVVMLYFIAVSSSRDDLQEALDWYVRGCITAAVIAIYQLLNATMHVPFPEAIIYSNKVHVVYRAYKIGGMWRLNGTFNEASEMAGFMIVGIALLGWKMMTRPFSLATAASLALLLFALISTQSSTGYATLVVLIPTGAVLYARYLFRGGMLSHGHIIMGVVLAMCSAATFSLSKDAVSTVSNAVTSTLLEKKNSDSYRERRDTDDAAMKTLQDTYYMGAGWGSARASGLFYCLLGNVGVPGVVLFVGFLGDAFHSTIARPAGNHCSFSPRCLCSIAICNRWLSHSPDCCRVRTW